MSVNSSADTGSKVDNIARAGFGPLPFREYYAREVQHMTQLSNDTVITEKNVFREANPLARRLLESFISRLLLPESCILGFENLQQIYRFATAEKKSTLILMEHYSNVDFPVLMHLLTKYGYAGSQIERAIVPMATMKLNEEHPALSAFTDAYTHISVFPARRLEQISMGRTHEEERRKAQRINHAAMHKMHELKQRGKIILMFPSGTRYKHNMPETKQVLKVVDSFIKRFDYIILTGIMGTLLKVNDPEDMLADYVCSDRMVYTFGAPIEVKKFRERRRSAVKQLRSEYKTEYKQYKKENKSQGGGESVKIKKTAKSVGTRDELAVRVTHQIEMELEKLHKWAETAYHGIKEEE